MNIDFGMLVEVVANILYFLAVFVLVGYSVRCKRRQDADKAEIASTNRQLRSELTTLLQQLSTARLESCDGATLSKVNGLLVQIVTQLVFGGGNNFIIRNRQLLSVVAEVKKLLKKAQRNG